MFIDSTYIFLGFRLEKQQRHVTHTIFVSRNSANTFKRQHSDKGRHARCLG